MDFQDRVSVEELTERRSSSLWFSGKSEMPAGQHPPLPCRASPPQGGRSDVAPLSPIASVAGRARPPKLPISPLAGEMSGRTEGV
ncbi:hypothetical protein FJ567_20695 [Mesorhizobium sp. B2-4-16]|nr:hypothetical protein FJ567_20695 [Mesorhizobium sp. B2-4-16]TPL66015.1 hypothetical protein FJ956_20575 [Mesorhizobium sp. B2-4-3]